MQTEVQKINQRVKLFSKKNMQSANLRNISWTDKNEKLSFFFLK